MIRASEIANSMINIDEELLKEAQYVEEQISNGVVEEKPFRMSDYIKPQMINEEEDVEKEAGEKEDNKTVAGAGVAGSGAALAKHTYDRGNLTGRETLYHNTRAENVDSIKKNGLKGQFATDKDKAFTPDLLNHIDEKDLKGKVYFGRKKAVAESVRKVGQQQDMLKGVKNLKRKTLKAKVPTWKMKEVDNPELLGSKNGKEWAEKMIDAKRNKMKSEGYAQQDIDIIMPKEMKNNKLLHMQGDYAHKTLGRKGTAVIEGSVDGKYFKGHKGYQKTSIKEVGEFIKKNPKRFVKGLGQVGAGAALAGVGGKMIYDAQKKARADKAAKLNKVNKIASILLEEVGFEKEAGVVSDFINGAKHELGVKLNKIPAKTEKTKQHSEFEDGKVTVKSETKNQYKNGKVETIKSKYKGSKNAQLPVVKKDSNINETISNASKGIKGKKAKIALGVAGTAAAGIGGKKMYDKHKAKRNKKVEKVAFAILEEAGFTK